MNAQLLCFLITAASSSGELPLSKYRLKTACDSSKHIIGASKKHKLDPLLLASLIYVESGWKKTAVSWAGACGLTQVLPKYSKYTCDELKKPKTSIYEGAYHLRNWSTQTKKPMKQALSCYNAGWVCEKNKKAKRYAKKVLALKEIYKKYYR